MKRRKKISVLTVIIVVLAAVILVVYLASRPPQNVVTDNRRVGLYRTHYLHQAEGPILHIPPNEELRYLDHRVRRENHFWQGAVKVEYNDQEGWVDYRYLSPESREDIERAARF